MKPVAAGNLRHPIRILRPPATTQDEFGAPIPQQAWQPFARSWASIEPISGREFDYAKSFAATVSHKVTMRYVAGVLATFRVQYGDRAFSIDAVLNTEERNRTLTLYCTEGAAQPQ